MVGPIDLLKTSGISSAEGISSGNSSALNKNFSDVLSSAIEKVNDLQYDALNKDLLLSNGSVDQLHDVMLSSVKADLALELTVAVRDKALEAYQEIMRMQV